MITVMPLADYLAHRAVGSGMCQTIDAQSPLHAWYQSPWNPLREARTSTPADIGTIAHACLLEGSVAKVRMFDPAEFPNATGGGVATGWTNKAIRTARDEARAEGLIPVLREDFDAVLAMVACAQEFLAGSELAGILEQGDAEATLLFKTRGVDCKARADFISGRVCLSYKTTTASARPAAWARAQLPNYDIASVFYERACREALERDARCVHLVQEQHPPYACSLIALDSAWHDLAAAKLDAALDAWRAFLAAKNPHVAPYGGRIAYAEPKPWLVSEFEERQMAQVLERADLSPEGAW